MIDDYKLVPREATEEMITAGQLWPSPPSKRALVRTHQLMTEAAPPAPTEAMKKVVLALKIIAGEEQCLDNLMSNADVAREALAALNKAMGAGDG